MGHVVVDAELAGARRERVRVLVDTGATYSVLPADLAERLRITEAPAPYLCEASASDEWPPGRSLSWTTVQGMKYGRSQIPQLGALPGRRRRGAGRDLARRALQLRERLVEREHEVVQVGKLLPVAVDAPVESAVVAAEPDHQREALEERHHGVRRPHERTLQV